MTLFLAHFIVFPWESPTTWVVEFPIKNVEIFKASISSTCVCATSPVLHITIFCSCAPAANDTTIPAPKRSSPPEAPLTGKLLSSFFLISLLIFYLGPFLCDCGEIHPTPFCPKDCMSSLLCSNCIGPIFLWPCNACFLHRQWAAQFSPLSPPSCPFSPIIINILTGGNAWDRSSPESPDFLSGMSNSPSH